MTIVIETFFCLECQKEFTKEKIGEHGCTPPFKVFHSTVTCHRKRYHRFIDWLLSQDIGYGLAFMGAVIINVILLPHFNLNFKESLMEGFCLGFVLMRLLK